MNSRMTDRVEELRQQGLAAMRANRMEEALARFDEGLALAECDEARELLTINKAGVLLALEQNGPEIQKLPAIVMRRRNLRHVYLAAYHLRRKFQGEKDYERALFYAKLALDAADEAGELEWKAEVLFSLGNLCVYESRIDEAIAYYAQVLELTPDDQEHALRLAFVTQNLGYARLMRSETEEGLRLIHAAVDALEASGAGGYAAESYIDLCYGYIELGDYATARTWGELGLAEATENRQVRNAHFLLGEAAYKEGDHETAEFHFEKLALLYPDFPHLKALLFALDLRGMVNLKL
jgi:tetratricopeptide (TPR) repeat protein